MPGKRKGGLVAIFSLLLIPATAKAETVYESHSEFLERAFGAASPPPRLAWLSGDRKTGVRQALGHDYPALRLRYWCRADRSAWILEEIGKDLPITVGVVVVKGVIESLRVLTYRENRGGEVATPAFTEQFNGLGLDRDGALGSAIDGITGATMSVRALTRLAKMALFLDTDVGCKSDA